MAIFPEIQKVVTAKVVLLNQQYHTLWDRRMRLHLRITMPSQVFAALLQS
jgi:hypothetical protein